MESESELTMSTVFIALVNFLKICYRAVMKVMSPFLDIRARHYLKKMTEVKIPRNGNTIRVAFLVFEPETWDKQEPIYREMIRRDDVLVDVLVVPNFNGSFSTGKTYGRELSFFQEECESVIPVYDSGHGLMDMVKANYDYIFYGDSYNRHMPWSLRSHQTVRYSRICYIPYGFSGSAIFGAISDNREFFRNVMYTFCDIPEKKAIFTKSYQQACDEGLQHFEYMGYPALEKYYSARFSGGDRDVPAITWTPRWSYDKKIGGSHFVEYKEDFLKFAQNNSGFTFRLRPHPMMFAEFISKGIMSSDEVDRYKENLTEFDIALSQTESITDILLGTDILLTDYSSIIAMFFLTGRPVIYCNSSIPFNDAYEAMRPGMYIANNWDDVELYLQKIISGDDYLEETRRAIIENYFGDVAGSASKIVNYLLDNE